MASGSDVIEAPSPAVAKAVGRYWRAMARLAESEADRTRCLDLALAAEASSGKQS